MLPSSASAPAIPRTDAFVEAAASPEPAPGSHPPLWGPVILAVAVLVWALNWRRGKPGLACAVFRRGRR